MDHKILKSDLLVKSIYDDISGTMEYIENPGLAIILIGDKKDSLTYIKLKRRKCKELGMTSQLIKLSELTTQSELLERIEFQSALTRRVIVGSRTKKTKVAITRTVTTFDDFKVGDMVEHSIFGAGKIMALSGTGENQRVGVVFNDGTRKKLIVKFANLKKL